MLAFSFRGDNDVKSVMWRCFRVCLGVILIVRCLKYALQTAVLFRSDADCVVP